LKNTSPFACSQWIHDEPREEGWFLWRRNKTTTDPWKWNAYYIIAVIESDFNGNTVEWSCWEAGTEVLCPTRNDAV